MTAAARAARGLAAVTGLVAAVTLAARLVGFGRWLVQSWQVGATCVGTAYTSANTVPNVVYEVAAGGALAAVVVPVIGGFLGQGRRAEADRTAAALLTWVLIVLVPLAAVVAALARPIAGLLIPSEQCAGQLDLAARMLIWFAPQIPLYGVGIVASGVLAAHHRFLAAALAPLLSSLVVIVGYLGYGALAPSGGQAAQVTGDALALLAGGTTAGVVLLSVPLLIPVRRLGVSLRPQWRFPPGVARRIGALAGAGIAALIAQQVSVVVITLVSNASVPGVINAYQYGMAVYLLPYAVLAVPIATTVVPRLASDQGAGERADDADATGLADRAGGAIRLVVLLCGMAAGVLLGVSSVVGRFFAAIDAGRDHDSGVAVAPAVATILGWSAPGLVAFALVALVGRAVLVAGRAREAATAQVIGWGLAAAIPALAVAAGANRPTQRLAAIGAGHAVGMTVAALLVTWSLRRAWGPRVLAGAPRALLAAVVAAIAAGLVGKAAAGALPTGGATGALAAGVGVGVLCALVAGAVALAIDPATLRSRLPGRR